jgi:Family of unknown function (DUF5760)
MATGNMNAAMMEQYLRQQQVQFESKSASYAPPSEAGASSAYGGRRLETALVETPDNVALEEFKHQVKLWLEIDNQVKKMQQVIREKKKVQTLLTEKILGFMARYNIEDLNTKDGKLRYKVSYTKPTVKKTEIKDKLLNYFEHDKALGAKVVEAVFQEEEQGKTEKVSLRRLKGVSIMNV